MKRRKFLRASLASTAALAVGASCSHSFSGGQNAVSLTILHTNDMHSRIDPFAASDKKFPNLGGMARRASLVSKIRTEEAHILLLDAGDIFQGTPYFNFFGGELEFKLMSSMGYDAATLGNHDFDAGLTGLAEVLPHAKFPFINSNYRFKETAIDGQIIPYQIFQKQNIRIGVFGLGIDPYGLIPENLYRGTTYEEPVSIAKEMVQELNTQKCDLIVCLSHLGYQYKSKQISDVKLAESVSGIDIILGGHTHTLLKSAERITNASGYTTVINQVGWAGIALGRIDVHFNNGKKEVAIQQNHMIAPVLNG